MSDQRDGQNQAYGQLITIWPEWNEQDLMAEKWDIQAITQGTKSSKDLKQKGTSFEDPEGRTRLPHSLLLVLREWKRPHELFGEALCVVRNTNRINLKDLNSHLMHSEFIRHYLSHIMIIWYNMQCKKLSQKNDTTREMIPIPPHVPLDLAKSSAGIHKEPKESKLNVSAKDSSSARSSQPEISSRALCFDDPMSDWAPWNLIYAGPPSAPKASGKGEQQTGQNQNNLPHYNPNGKYAVRLYWMGSWRKVIVDDFVPVDENNRSLLPVCGDPREIWPIILTKAVMKVVSLDYGGGTSSSEIGDPAFILHVLTGYVPYVVYLNHPKSSRKAIWNKLQSLLPLNKKSPPEDVLSALAVNWDVRTYTGLKSWRLENHPAYLSKVQELRSERMQSSLPNIMAANPIAQITPAPANPATLAPKGPLARGASARSSTAAPRKLDLGSPGNLTPNPASTTIDASKSKQPKTPELFLFATYRSAHHDTCPFDSNEKSRSGKLYENGLLRSESHPILLRHLRDVYPKRPKKVLIPRYKLFRHLRVVMHRYSQILDRAAKQRTHAARYVEFLSLMWKAKGRLIHQTSTRAARLTAKKLVVDPSCVMFKPMDGYKATLPAIPESFPYPRQKVKPVPEVVVKQPSPPPSPPHDEKPLGKGKPADVKDSALPLLEGVPPPPQPPHTGEHLQKICRLNLGSIEFNQFFEALESVYVFCKPETFDYQALFSFYQSNITDGKLPSAKKKGTEPTSQGQNVSSEREGTKSTSKPPMSPTPVKYGKIPTDLPSPFVIVDNPHPTNIVFSVSCVSRWFFNQRTEAKSQDQLSIVAGTIEELKGHEKPYPIVLSFKHHDWLDGAYQPTLFTLKTSSVQGVCFHVPAGRHIWRLKITCPGRRELEPHGFAIRVMSRDPVQIGSEELILKVSVLDSYQFSSLAHRAMAPILKWWRTNGNPLFSHPPHREVILALGLEDDACNKTTRRVFSDAMLKGIYSAIQLCLKEFCNAKGAFTLRVFLGDLATTNILNFTTQLGRRDSKLAAAPPPTAKTDTHGNRQTETLKRSKKAPAEPLTSPTARLAPPVQAVDQEAQWQRIAKKEAQPPAGPKEIKAFSIWHQYLLSVRSNNVLEARLHGKKRREDVLKSAQEMLDAIVRNEVSFSNCFFRNLCRGLPTSWLDLSFFYNQETRYIWKDFSGNFAELPPDTWRLLFRDTFNVTEPFRIAFRLTVNLAPCRFHVVNNDTGEVIPSAFFHALPYSYSRNEAGYSVVAEAKSGNIAWKAAPWALRIVQGLDPLRHQSTQAESLMIRFGTNALSSTFIVKDVSDYFLPVSDCSVLARVLVKVKLPTLTTVTFTTSNQDVLFELRIGVKDRVVYRTYGRGIAVIPAFLFKTEANQTETYKVQSHILDASWPLNGAEWKFAYAERNRRMTVDYGRESPPPPPSTSPVKSAKEVSAKRSGKTNKEKDREDRLEKDSTDGKGSRAKEKEKDKHTLDCSRPHWTLKFTLDPSESEFDCSRDTENDELYKAEILAAISADPSVLQRGRDFREEYLRKNATLGILTPDSSEYPGWSAEVVTSNWPQATKMFLGNFDLGAFTQRSAGDSSGELDLLTYDNEIRRLKERFSEAAEARMTHAVAEKGSRDEQILGQMTVIRNMMDVTLAGRRAYVEQRDIYKKQLDDLAVEEERRLVPTLPLDHTKACDDKHKKHKK